MDELGGKSIVAEVLIFYARHGRFNRRRHAGAKGRCMRLHLLGWKLAARRAHLKLVANHPLEIEKWQFAVRVLISGEGPGLGDLMFGIDLDSIKRSQTQCFRQ